MKRTPIFPDPGEFPAEFHPFFSGAQVYDSSCSPEARVYYLDKDAGFYLKSAAKGMLEREAALTAYFHGKQLAAEVLAYTSAEKDWLLTRRLPGEDCLNSAYLEDPKGLCDTCAELLRALHEQDHGDCPVPDLTAERLTGAEKHYQRKQYDTSLFPDNWGYDSPEEAWSTIEKNARYLKTDTLLHGDYCLPNILLDDWRFSGFIDLGGGGVGDRHFDLFWGIWSLSFNLKTDAFRQRFLDAYGRELVNEEALRLIAAIEVFG